MKRKPPSAAVIASLALLISLGAAGPARAAVWHRHRPSCGTSQRLVVRRARVRWAHARRDHHRRWHRVREWRCTRRPVRRTVRYRAKVDPTFTQSPSDPLAVTYAYSADATLTDQNGTTDLAKAGELPAGVLNFYSAQQPGGPESLFCSMNVGGATAGGNCPITYSQTGTFEVTTQYIPSGAAAVTETDEETVSPFATTTTLSASEGACGSGSPPGYTVSGPYCEYTLADSVLRPDEGAVTSEINETTGDPSSDLVLVFTPAGSGEQEAAPMPIGGTCTVYVTPARVLSPDCGFDAQAGQDGVSVSAFYGGPPGSGWEPAPGWQPSESPRRHGHVLAKHFCKDRVDDGDAVGAAVVVERDKQPVVGVRGCNRRDIQRDRAGSPAWGVVEARGLVGPVDVDVD